MMKMLRSTLATVALTLAGIGSASAHDGVGFSISIGTSPGFYHAPPVISYAPPVVYYAAPPVVYYRDHSPRTYYRSYASPRHYGHGHNWGKHRHHRHHHHHHRR